MRNIDYSKQARILVRQPSVTQERIIRAVKCMDDASALKLWNVILGDFEEYARWALIPEEEPDDFDLYMLEQIDNDPECHEFAKEYSYNVA